MNVTVQQDKCLACGMCTSIAPELFSLETGLATLKKQPDSYTEDDKTLAREASAACPNEAIVVTE